MTPPEVLAGAILPRVCVPKAKVGGVVVSCSAAVGGLHHLRGRRPADCHLLPVCLHQVLLPREEEEAAEEEGRQDQSDRGQRKIHRFPGEQGRPLEAWDDAGQSLADL